MTTVPTTLVVVSTKGLILKLKNLFAASIITPSAHSSKFTTIPLNNPLGNGPLYIKSLAKTKDNVINITTNTASKIWILNILLCFLFDFSSNTAITPVHFLIVPIIASNAQIIFIILLSNFSHSGLDEQI